MQKVKHFNLAIILYFLFLLIISIERMINDLNYIDVFYSAVLLWGIFKVIIITVKERR